MSHISNTRRPAVGAVMAVSASMLACLGLAACGGSGSSTTSTNASATKPAGAVSGTTSTGTSTTPNHPSSPGAFAGRFKALRECMQKNGITLPERTRGQRPPGGGYLGGTGGPQLPSGVTRAQFEAAIKKCGGSSSGGGAFFGGGKRAFNSPAFKQSLSKFDACMRENGVKLPEPNTSGKGPIFSTKGLDTTSPQFRAAESKCRSDLQGTFRHGYGATGAPPSGGAVEG